MMNNELAIQDAKFEILDQPGEGFQSRNVIYTIARRLINHTAGKIIGGYEEKDGKMVPVKNAYSGGSLILQDAMYAVEYGLTRGLNPYGHLHLWYQRSSNSPTPQLIIDIDYKILKGWAEWRSAFRSKPFVMTDEERQTYGLANGDLGAVVYNILDDDVDYLHQYQLEFIKSGMPFSQAQRLAHQAVAKSEGIGVIKAPEMRRSDGKAIPPPKGRTWQWRAETRAFRDATRRSHGEPPPAQIRQYAAGQGLAISERHLALMASPDYPADLPAEDQQQYLLAADHTEKPTTKHNLSLVNGLMRDNGDDDPLDLSPEEIATESGPDDETDQQEKSVPEPPADLVKIRDAITYEAINNPRKGDATETQLGLLADKLAECFAGDDEAESKAVSSLTWLCGRQPIKFGHAQAMLSRLLLSQDKETGDYPLNRQFAKTIQSVYIQWQIESGQLELL